MCGLCHPFRCLRNPLLKMQNTCLAASHSRCFVLSLIIYYFTSPPASFLLHFSFLGCVPWSRVCWIHDFKLNDLLLWQHWHWSKCIIKCVITDPRHVCRNVFLKMNILNFSKTLEKRDDKNTVNFNSPHATWMQNLSVLWLFGSFHYESLPFTKIIPQLTLRPAELWMGQC